MWRRIVACIVFVALVAGECEGAAAPSAAVPPVPLRRTTASRKMLARARAGDPMYQRHLHANTHGAHWMRKHHVATTPDGAVQLHGCPFADFTAEVSLGADTFSLLVDTGSSTLALAGDSCTSCVGVTPRWNASTASTDMMGTAAGTYGDGSGWLAHVWRDTVRVGTTEVTPSTFSATEMRLAVITSQSSTDHNADGSSNPGVGPFFFTDACFDNPDTYQQTVVLQGIMGMAFSGLAAAGTDSFPARLFDTHPSLPKKFALQMCAHSGNLWLGNEDPTSYVGQPLFTPVSDTNLYWSVTPSEMYINNAAMGFTPDDFTSNPNGINIIDSGTTMWELPAPVYRRIVDTLIAHPAFALYFRAQPTNNFFDHGSTSCETTKVQSTPMWLQHQLPTLTLQFANGLSLTMDGVGSYLLPCTDAYNQWTPGIGPGSMGMIAGWPLMNQFITVHDMENVRIGFAPVRACDTGIPPLRANVTMGRPIIVDTPPPTQYPGGGGVNCGGTAYPQTPLLLLLAVVVLFMR